MPLSINVALLGQEGVVNSTNTQQSSAAQSNVPAVNSTASPNAGRHGFGFGHELLSAVFQAISQVQSDLGTAAPQGGASSTTSASAVSSAGSPGSVSGTGSSVGTASSTSGSSATTAPAGQSSCGPVQSGSNAAFDQALTQFLSALFDALSVALQQTADAQPTPTASPVRAVGAGNGVSPASAVSSGLTQLAQGLPSSVSSASSGTSVSTVGSAASSAATTPTATTSPSPATSTPSSGVASSTTSLSGSTAPSLQDALETLQADFAALLQSAGVNTGASQSSASGSGASATGGTESTNSSITAALQNFLQQLSQALSGGGQTYGRHHGHGHRHGAQPVQTSTASAGTASSPTVWGGNSPGGGVANSSPASAASPAAASAPNLGSSGQNIEIGIFIDITA